jgi:hypothetical protein
VTEAEHLNQRKPFPTFPQLEWYFSRRSADRPSGSTGIDVAVQPAVVTTHPAGPFAAILSLVALTTACGGAVVSSSLTGPTPIAATAPAPSPTAPAGQVYPSLVGRWRSDGTRITYRNRETGVQLGSFNCEGSMNVASQTASEFAGTISTSGHGWNSDRFCTYVGELSAEMLSPAGAVRGRLDARIGAHQCTFVSGDGVFAGSATADAIRLETTDVYRCPVNLDGGPGMPIAEFERTVTLSFGR